MTLQEIIEGVRNNTLTEIRLSGTPINPEEIKALSDALKGNQSVIQIDFSQTQIGAEGAKALGEALKVNRSVTYIRLWNCSIGVVGAKVLSEVLKVNQNVKTIILFRTQMGDEGVEALSEVLKENKSVTEINFSANKTSARGTKALCEMLKVNQSVTQINFHGDKISDAEAEALGDVLKVNQSMTQIDLCDSQIGDIGAKALGEALKVNKSMTHIRLMANGIGDIGAKALGEALKVNQSIIQIDLQSNQIGADGAKALAEGLKENHSVTEIDLSGNKIGSEGAKALGEALKVNQSVTQINLNCNQIRDEGAKALGEWLEVNQSVTQIKLSSNKIGDIGAKALGEGLEVNQSVTEVNLSHNQIGAEGAKALGIGLGKNQTVTKINLWANQIGAEGARAFGEALKVNQSVTEISIGSNQIGDVGAKAISEALKVNRCLICIDICWNQIGPEGGQAIAAALQENKTVTRIVLNKDQIGADAEKLIQEYLTRNKKLAENLLEAARQGDLDYVQKLLKEGVSPYTQDKDQNTILHLAAIYQHETLLKYLLSLPLNRRIKNKDGKTIYDLIPDDYFPLLLKAKEDLAVGRYRKVIAQCMTILQSDSQISEAYLLRGQAHYKLCEQDTTLTLDAQMALLKKAENEINSYIQSASDADSVRKEFVEPYEKIAAEDLRRTISKDLKRLRSTNAHLMKAKNDLAAGRYSEAIKQCTTVINSEPQIFKAHLLRGQARYKLCEQDTTLTLDAQMALLKEAGNDINPYVQSTSDVESARKEFVEPYEKMVNEVKKKITKRKELLEKLNAHEQAKNYQSALEVLNALIEIDPNDQSLAYRKAVILHLFAKSVTDQSFDKAIGYLEQAEKIAAEDLRRTISKDLKRLRFANTCLMKAKDDLAAGRYVEAIKQCTTVINSEPQIFKAHLLRGQARYKLCEQDTTLTLDAQMALLKEAGNDINPYIQNVPDVASVRKEFVEPYEKVFNKVKSQIAKRKKLLKKLNAHEKSKEYQLALETLNVAIEIDSNNKSLAHRKVAIKKSRHEKAIALYHEGNNQEAIVLFNQILNDESDFSVLIMRGIAYSRILDTQSASNDMDTILAAEISDFDTLLLRAEYLVLFKKDLEAVRDCDAALRIAKENSEDEKAHALLFQIGSEYQNVGKFNEATDELKMLLLGYVELPSVFRQLLSTVASPWVCRYDSEQKVLEIISRDNAFIIALKQLLVSNVELKVIDAELAAEPNVYNGISYTLPLRIDLSCMTCEDVSQMMLSLSAINPIEMIYALASCIEIMNVSCVSDNALNGLSRFFSTYGLFSSEQKARLNELTEFLKGYRAAYFNFRGACNELWQLSVKHKLAGRILAEDQCVKNAKRVDQLNRAIDEAKKQVQHANLVVNKRHEQCINKFAEIGEFEGSYYLSMSQQLNRLESLRASYEAAEGHLTQATTAWENNTQNTSISSALTKAHQNRDTLKKSFDDEQAKQVQIWQRKKTRYHKMQGMHFTQLMKTDINFLWCVVAIIEPAMRIAITRVILDLQTYYEKDIRIDGKYSKAWLVQFIYSQLKQLDIFQQLDSQEKLNGLVTNLAVWIRTHLESVKNGRDHIRLNIDSVQFTLNDKALRSDIEPYLCVTPLKGQEADDTWWQKGESWYKEYSEKEVNWYVFVAADHPELLCGDLLLFLLKPSKLSEVPSQAPVWQLIFELLGTYVPDEELPGDQSVISSVSWQQRSTCSSLPTEFRPSAPSMSNVSDLVLGYVVQPTAPPFSESSMTSAGNYSRSLYTFFNTVEAVEIPPPPYDAVDEDAESTEGMYPKLPAFNHKEN